MVGCAILAATVAFLSTQIGAIGTSGGIATSAGDGSAAISAESGNDVMSSSSNKEIIESIKEQAKKDEAERRATAGGSSGTADGSAVPSSDGTESASSHAETSDSAAAGEAASTSASVSEPAASPSSVAEDTGLPADTLEPVSEEGGDVETSPSQSANGGGSNLNIYYVSDTKSGINLRAEPRHESALVAEVPNGVSMLYLHKVGQGLGSDGVIHDWYYLATSSGAQGWARADLIRPSGSGIVDPNAYGSCTVLVSAASSGINLRSLPQHESELVTGVPNGVELRYYGTEGTGYGSDGELHTWYLVEVYGGTWGWARSDLVREV